MKIAIATDDRQSIAGHFGRCRGFEIVDVEDGTVNSKEFRENDFTGHARGMQGHHGDKHSAILDALQDCNTVISHGMGRRIYTDLQNAGIDSIITRETHIDQAIDAYLSGDLEDYPEQGCNHSHHRH